MNTTNDKRPRMPVGDTRRALPLLAVLLLLLAGLLAWSGVRQWRDAALLDDMQRAAVREFQRADAERRGDHPDEPAVLLDAQPPDFDLDREPESMRAVYGENAFGAGCLLAPPPADDLLELARAGLLANSASLQAQRRMPGSPI